MVDTCALEINKLLLFTLTLLEGYSKSLIGSEQSAQ